MPVVATLQLHQASLQGHVDLSRLVFDKIPSPARCSNSSTSSSKPAWPNRSSIHDLTASHFISSIPIELMIDVKQITFGDEFCQKLDEKDQHEYISNIHRLENMQRHIG
jgi:hypothetical protein